MTHGQQGQFHVTTDFQFIKYTVTVTVDRFRAQAELVGDFLNLLTVHDHHGNLHFTLGQPFKNVFVRFRLIGTQRQFLRDVRADITLPGIHHPDCLHHFLDIGPLGDISRGTGLHDTGWEQVILNGSHRNDTDTVVEPFNLADCFQPANPRHAQIHQHNVHIACTRELNGFLTAGGFADNIYARLISQHTSDASPNQIMIVDNQNFDQNPPLERPIHEPSSVPPWTVDDYYR